jgi:hypothetical protein
LAEAKDRSGSGDSSGEEDSDDEDEAGRSQQDSSTHDEVSCSTLLPVIQIFLLTLLLAITISLDYVS